MICIFIVLSIAQNHSLNQLTVIQRALWPISKAIDVEGIDIFSETVEHFSQ